VNDARGLASELARARTLALLVDFDGTLAEIVARSRDARPRAGALRALERLAARDVVAIVSGRALGDLAAKLAGLRRAWLVGSHGAAARSPRGETIALADVAAARAPVVAFAAHAHALLDPSGGDVEDKGASAVGHLRPLAPTLAPARERALVAHGIALSAGGTTDVLVGKAIVELRARGVDKGAAARWLLARAGPVDLAVALGDDATDEDMLREVAARGGVTVKVGPGPSVAERRLAGPVEVEELLEELAAARLAARPG
jgi:trehalose-phosphatase